MRTTATRQRTFLLWLLTVVPILVALAAIPPAPAAAAGTCTSVLPRKEIRKLTSAEWQRFVSAVKKLNSGPHPTVYDRFVRLHLDNQVQVHGYAMFFPFMRQYVRAFEQELQKIDPTVTIPYWDWSLDWQAPAQSVVFTNAYMGGNGVGTNRTVQNGQFANWTVYYPNSHILRRDFDQGSSISPWYSRDMINSIISTSSTYDQLRNAYENVPYGSVHVNIGGDMATMAAPNDPIFWLHAAFTDKVWDDWQWRHLAQWNTVNGRLQNGTAIQPTTAIPGYTLVKVQDVLNIANLCYVYQ